MNAVVVIKQNEHADCVLRDGRVGRSLRLLFSSAFEECGLVEV
jgi:hypothetical protein